MVAHTLPQALLDLGVGSGLEDACRDAFEHLEWALARLVQALPAEDPAAPPLGQACELLEEPGLPASRLGFDHDQAPVARAGLLEVAPESGQLHGASHEYRLRQRAALVVRSDPGPSGFVPGCEGL